MGVKGLRQFKLYVMCILLLFVLFVINEVKLHISTIFITFVMSCEVICCSVYFSLTKKLFFFMAEYSHG